MVFDPEPIGNGVRVLIDVGLERGDTPGQVLGRGMAVMVSDILAQPAPQRLDCVSMLPLYAGFML